MTSDTTAAIREGITGEELQKIPLPETFSAAVVEACDAEIFKDQEDKDVRRSIKIRQVPFPELEPDEVIVAVMASAINFNTVWTARFEPISTFSFLTQLGRQSSSGKRHDLPYHILGSDASGIVVRTGASVKNWQVGNEVVVHTAYINSEDPMAQHDGMLSEDLRAWGYETNFGGLAEYTIVKATQLLPKAPLLTWEEAASVPLCGGTAYRMVVSDRGARMKQGESVLIWGATGGLGALTTQLVRNGGGIAIGIVSSEEKAELAYKVGCEAVVDRSVIQKRIGSSQLTPKAWRLLRREIRKQIGEDPNIVVDYTGKQTFGASVYLAKRGGRVVTCGSSSGYEHEYDNRYLWMNLKSIIGSHGANLQEAWETNRLVSMGRLLPTVSRTYNLDETADATRAVQLNQHVGKVAILCLASNAGEGIGAPVKRAKVGEDRFHQFRESTPQPNKQTSESPVLEYS